MSAFGDLAKFFAVEAPRLRRFLRRFGPAISPEDIAQDSFARLCAVDPGTVTSPRAYLFRTARNLAITELRRRRRGPIDPHADAGELDCPAEAPSPEDCTIAANAGELLAAALESLPERKRQALILFKIEGLSHKEIGARLGVSHRTVERYVADALASCNSVLKATLAEDDL